MRSHYFIVILISLLCANEIFAQIEFSKHNLESSRNKISGIYCSDVDGDGDNDILACYRTNNQVVLWQNTGNENGRWNKHVISNEITDPLYIYSDDLDNNGVHEVLVTSSLTNQLSSITYNSDMEVWETVIVSKNISGGHGIKTGDIDNDGLIDIVATGVASGTIVWWKNNSDKPYTWKANTITSDLPACQTVFVIDLNNDGNLDIVGSSSQTNDILAFINNGDETPAFQKIRVTEGFALPHWVSCADIDGDGDNDIFASAYVGSRISWFENTGNFNDLWPAHKIGTGFLHTLTVESADFDLDGDIDVVGTAEGNGELSVWENSGNSPVEWTKHKVSTTVIGAWPVSCADLDNDGDIDIVAAGDLSNGNALEPPIAWWENKLITKNETSISNNYLTQNKVFIYPNPIKSQFTIKFNNTVLNTFDVKLYDIGGEVVYIKKVKMAKGKNISSHTINQSILPGLYNLIITDENEWISKKIMIQ